MGFRCSPYSEEGLLANQVSLDLDSFRVALTTANAHVVERTPELIRSYPRESIFVNVICAGETFVYQRGHCHKVHRGDVLVYDARYPYLVGGADQFSLLHIDIPVDLFHSQFVRTDLNKPVQVSSANGTHRLYSHTLSTLMTQLLDHPERADLCAESLHAQICDLLGAMMGQGSTSALSAGHLLAAKAFIEDHLGDDELRIEQIAHAVGISERHLRRLFAAENISLTDHLLLRRLEHARDELCDPKLHNSTVAEIAYRCGFSSQAHFSRSFKQQFGMTPTDCRRAQPH